MVGTFVFPGLRCLRIGILALAPLWFGAPVNAAIAAPSYDFAYRVSGDRRVAPQQVFDDGASTYLQFYPGQVLPALIAIASDGTQRLLTHAQLGPYVTVPGTHAALVAQLGTVRAVIDYGGRGARVAGEDAMGIAVPAPPAVSAVAPQGVPFAPPWVGASSPPPAVPVVAAPVAAARPPAAAQFAAGLSSAASVASEGNLGVAPRGAGGFAPAGPSSVPSLPDDPIRPVAVTPATRASQVAAAASAGPIVTASGRDIAPVMANADASTVAEAWPTATAPAAKPFEATLADQNLRRALSRWAGQAGWTFRPEHWTPDIDIAVSASATFGPDFKTAVRGLLAGTELSAKPLQPCFYSNLVLRVVPQTERCDRRVAQ